MLKSYQRVYTLGKVPTIAWEVQFLLDSKAIGIMDFDYLGAEGEAGKGAAITLKVNDETVGKGKMKSTVPGRFGIDTFGIGEDSGQPVTTDYKTPFKFTGEISKVTIESR